MKMSDRNTALHLLTASGDTGYDIEDFGEGVHELRDFIQHDLPILRHLFKQRIQYISKPFMEAFYRATEKDLFRLVHEPIEQWGTFIIPLPSSGQITVFYQFRTAAGEEGWHMQCTIYVFDNNKDKSCPYLIALVRRSGISNITYIDSGWKHDDKHLIDLIFLLILFIKYAPVETKMVESGKKTIHASQKFFNDTKSPIEILDSTWFTTLIRSEEFTVGASTGGFFRLQPCGKELKDRKLIWISPYTKHGYIRKAKILGQPPKE
jgi:hypothetical protein